MEPNNTAKMSGSILGRRPAGTAMAWIPGLLYTRVQSLIPLITFGALAFLQQRNLALGPRVKSDS